MPDTFAPQLALFVAGRSELALYREFVFPSVPARTGLLAAGIDDIRANNPEIAPLAIDIALTKAAVVVYDRAQRSRLPLDYIESLRGTDPIVVVETGARPVLMTPNGNPHEQTLVRPSEMSVWVEQFVEPLLSKIDAVALAPTASDIEGHLRTLAAQRRHTDLLLTSLALLEHQMRREDLPTAVPTNPSGGLMARLRDHFGPDYQVVIEGVTLRHGLLQNPRPDAGRGDENVLRSATALVDVVRRRFGVPQPQPQPPP